MKIRFLCQCGHNITTNTMKCHIKGKHCTASTDWKEFTLKLADLKTLHACGWLISEGDEATLHHDWWLSVINKETALEDWQFCTPRDNGCMPPSVCKRYREDRKGNNNPVNKVRNKLYDEQFLKDTALTLWVIF